jgi:hypothetical protein
MFEGAGSRPTSGSRKTMKGIESRPYACRVSGGLSPPLYLLLY